MSKVAGLAGGGGCMGSLIGLALGALLGLVIGAACVGNSPVGPPSDDGQREFARQVQIKGNSFFKFLGGTVGLLVGGVLGTAIGAGAGAAFGAKIGSKAAGESPFQS